MNGVAEQVIHLVQLKFLPKTVFSTSQGLHWVVLVSLESL